MTLSPIRRSRGPGRTCGVVALSLASACASVCPDATVGEFPSDVLRASLAATICAEALREAFPSADGYGLTLGAPVFVHDADTFTVAYGGHAPAVHYAANARIAARRDGAALDPLQIEWSRAPQTSLPWGARVVRVEIRHRDGQVRVQAVGALATSGLRARLRADLTVAAAIERAAAAVASGRHTDARAALAPWVAASSGFRPGRRWLARACFTAARLELAAGDLGRASVLLGRALDEDQDLLAARVELAHLSDELAEDRARDRHRRTLAALAGNGFAALGAIVALPRAPGPRNPADLLHLAQRLAAERAPAADLFRVAQQARDTVTGAAQADALTALATAAERLGQPHRAHELHLARALLLGTTPAIVRDLSRTALAQGNAERAAHLLSAHWPDVADLPGVRDDLAASLAALPPDFAERLARAGPVPPRSPAAAPATPISATPIPAALAAPPR